MFPEFPLRTIDRSVPAPAACKLVEDVANLGITSFRRERFLGPGKPMLIVFGPAELHADRPVYRRLLAQIDCNYLIFQSRLLDFFVTDWAEIQAHIQKRVAEWAPRRTVCWGYSMGAYASIRAGLEKGAPIDCAVALSPYFRLTAPYSRAQRDQQIPKGIDYPDLVEALNRTDRQTRFRIYMPTHSIRDAIHVLYAQEVKSASVEIHYMNVDHGIELKWKEDGSLKSAFECLISDKPWTHSEKFTASPDDVSTALTAVNYYYQSYDEHRSLPELNDGNVMEARWHTTKAIAYRAQGNWGRFYEAAARALRLGAAREGFPEDYKIAFDRPDMAMDVSARILSWTLEHDIAATEELLQSPRTLEIIQAHLGFVDLCYLLPFTTGETARATTQQIVLRCSHETSSDLGVFAIAAADLNLADAIERIAHQAAAHNVNAAADALFQKLASIHPLSHSDIEAWRRAYTALGWEMLPQPG